MGIGGLLAIENKRESLASGHCVANRFSIGRGCSLALRVVSKEEPRISKK